jgi:hypothetical protein
MDKMHHPCMANGKNANVENPSMFWQQGRTHYLQLANPKKKVLKNWQNLWIFSKSFLWGLSFGVFVGMFVFCGKLVNFRKKKKKKLLMIFYKYLIILLYSWLHIGLFFFWKKCSIFFTCGD